MARNVAARTTWERWALLAFALLLAANAWHHDLWGDEAQAWLLARDSPTLPSLLHNLRYEGTPPLWHLVLWVLTRFTTNPEWMKAPTALFALLTAALVLRARALPAWVRVGIVFSYFFAFEYSVVNRNYMLGVLLVVATARRMADSRRGVEILLTLAALSSLHALTVAFCLYAWQLAHPREKRPWSFALLMLATVAFALWAIHPPPDFYRIPHIELSVSRVGVHLIMLCNAISDAFVPIPRATAPFWNRPVLCAFPVLHGFLGLGMAGVLILCFRRHRARWFFYGAAFLLLAAMFFTERVYERHVGWLFVLVVLSLLLEPDAIPRPRILGGLLTVQVLATVVVFVGCWRYPFTNNKAATAYMRSYGLTQAPLVMPESVGTPLLAYLDRTAYYPGRGPGRSFVVWNKAWRSKNTDIHRTDLEAAGLQPILIVEEPLTAEQQNALHVGPLASFDGPSCQGETLFLYR